MNLVITMREPITTEALKFNHARWETEAQYVEFLPDYVEYLGLDDEHHRIIYNRVTTNWHHEDYPDQEWEYLKVQSKDRWLEIETAMLQMAKQWGYDPYPRERYED